MNSISLHPLRLQELARNWLLEDTSSFNFGGFVVEEQEKEFEILMKSPGVLAGIPFVDEIFSQLGATVLWSNSERDTITSETKIASVFGSANKLLLAEPAVLNVLSRASGIATITSKLCKIIKKGGWEGAFVGTDKLTPGFKMVEEYSLHIGGAMYRYDSANTVVLKYNHICVAGSIEKAIEKVRKVTGLSRKIKVECHTFQEAQSAGKSGCNIIMLNIIESQEVVLQALNLKLQYPSMLIEVSGRITEQNIEEYLHPWIDIISSSYLVESYPIIDFSMKVIPITIKLQE